MLDKISFEPVPKLTFVDLGWNWTPTFLPTQKACTAFGVVAQSSA